MSKTMVQAIRLSRSYGEVRALVDVTISVDRGEWLGVMGPSGSGKTTLLNILGGLDRPTLGSLSVDGNEIAGASPADLARYRRETVGLVFQQFHLVQYLTALENVAIVGSLNGLKNGAARSRAAALLADLGMSERLTFLPEKLSGGEKQRVAIARALMNDPAVILADEPTANLDSKIGHEIMRLLQHIAQEQGRSVVIVSHDQRIKDIADRVLWLEDGQFKEMVAMAVDPVCGMSVERERAAATMEWEGTTYYFCSRGCRSEYAEQVSAAYKGEGSYAS